MLLLAGATWVCQLDSTVLVGGGQLYGGSDILGLWPSGTPAEYVVSPPGNWVIQ